MLRIAASNEWQFVNAHQRGHLNRWLPFSLVDGPGNRFVVFLQGCNFNCLGCHNPHTIADCNGCGLCVDDCPELALFPGVGTTVEVDRQTCTDCDICIDVCPYNSTPLSRYVTVAETVEQIRPVAPFLSGLTVSGGEATMQAGFVRELFATVKGDPELAKLTTFIDSNGSAERQIWDLLAPVTDGVMVDLKALDPQTHRELTGKSNETVLESIRHLTAIGLLHEVRLLIVPGFNDSRTALVTTAQWLRGVDPDMALKVIGFRNHGVRPAAATLTEPSAEALLEVAACFRSEGFANVTVV